MFKKKIRLNDGFTLIETIVTVAIFSLIAVIALPMIIMNNRITASQLKESAERNEVRVASTFLTNDIRYSKDIDVDETKLQIITSNGEIINYYIQENDGNSFLIRETENLYPFYEIKNVVFVLEHENLVAARLITDKEQNQYTDYKIARWKYKLTPNQGEQHTEDFYSFIQNKNVFVYGSTLSIFGSTSVNSNTSNEGMLIVNNVNHSDLVFSGNNSISMKNIFIDKGGNKLIFSNSTKLGKAEVTDVVYIKGDVLLDRGGAEINGNYIYIDGNVTFANTAKISGKEIYINGNVIFQNWSALLIADRIYINGVVTFRHSGNIVGDLKYVSEIPIPTHIDVSIPPIPPLRPDNWYSEKGYNIGGALTNGVKIFANNYSFIPGATNNFQDVIIVSKNDITLKGNMHITGVLFAPNGKVYFDSGSFEGIVIARDGFFVTNGGSKITFKSITNFIQNTNDYPF